MQLPQGRVTEPMSGMMLASFSFDVAMGLPPLTLMITEPPTGVVLG